jgi:hypothetical protein
MSQHPHLHSAYLAEFPLLLRPLGKMTKLMFGWRFAVVYVESYSANVQMRMRII